jgi:ferredoxin
MTYVIAEPCIDVKDELDYDAVEQLFIDPDECIDCDACVEACPVDATFAEDQLPGAWLGYAAISADYYKRRHINRACGTQGPT